ncbi:DUF1700 domain-containing protein [Streptococcus devriesei]|uniref:DUF1700 domain-containing protein n=1 Tax=Streptococcus devriesei TaxID=231233 RepID=UPI0004068570|nr:DUF1700 domain-containing protein [Streptococcus devriesei]
MTKAEYLSQLEHYLKRLPQADYEEAMDYFTEYFEEAGPEREEEIIRELGSPKEAAHDILSQLIEKNQLIGSSPKQTIWLTILAVLAAPMALPLTIAALGVILAIIITALSSILITVSFSFVGFVSSLAFLWEALTKLSDSLSTLSLGLGASFLSLGISLLFAAATILLARLFKFIFLKFNQWIAKRGYKS